MWVVNKVAFSVDKCMVIRTGKHDEKTGIKINIKNLKFSEKNRDLEIIVHNNSNHAR